VVSQKKKKKSFPLDTAARKLSILMFKLYLQSLASRNPSHFSFQKRELERKALRGSLNVSFKR
jgi:hypothetical protein